MDARTVKIGNCSLEILLDGKLFRGLGRAWIDGVLVRSGRLPLRPETQSFKGVELARLLFRGVKAAGTGIRIRLAAEFRPLFCKVMRDHSFDPIHETGDWDRETVAGSGELDIVLAPARDCFNGVEFGGFSYHYEYRSKDVPLYWLMDLASWELGGDISGATAVSQSACSAPVARFDTQTSWTTEGILFFLVEKGGDQNPVMTHNLPRWASHQAFDFQYKGNDTLIGVFERVELIRTVHQRDAGKPELKCFDKHIFDQASEVRTAAKSILLNRAAKTAVGQQNLWSWVFEDVDARARAEFGIKETPMIPFLYQNFWVNFTVDSYYKDLLPAAAAIGARKLFLDNLKKSAMTEQAPLPGKFNWNMCCGHEYEISDRLGGVPRVKAFTEEAKKLGISPMCWTNNDQALSSPINDTERDEKNWFVRLEDTRLKYGGAYSSVMSVLDMASEGARKYFVDSHIKIKEQTGMDCFFFDSFYNLAFMPVNYANCRPRTMWRGLLQAFRELQQGGITMAIESFGPWGQVCHGHPSSYDIPNIFACYKVGVGNDYTTVPTGHLLKDVQPKDAAGVYYTLAHMAGCYMPLFFPDGKRIDQVWTAEHKRALADYHAALPSMTRRYLQEDGLAVVWHDAKGKRATVFNFRDRSVRLPGKVVDISTGEAVSGKAGRYRLKACHTYAVTGVKALPTVL